jgi:hypothetical protein
MIYAVYAVGTSGGLGSVDGDLYGINVHVDGGLVYVINRSQNMRFLHRHLHRRLRNCLRGEPIGALGGDGSSRTNTLFNGLACLRIREMDTISLSACSIQIRSTCNHRGPCKFEMNDLS